MSFHFTPNQEEIIQRAVHWYQFESEQVFQITGNPGTGKSVVLNEVIRRLGIAPEDVAPMAYTGAASVVMRMKGLLNAKTIHSWLYEPKEVPTLDENGNTIFDSYYNCIKMHIEFVPRDISNIKLIVIDEGGSVPISMKDTILKTGAKVLVAGDLDQLPPVSDNPAFLYSGRVHRLTQIMRQAAYSPIIYLSQRAKAGYPIHVGNYGNVLVISADDVTDDMILNSPVVLCGRNETREKLTKHIREDLLHRGSILPGQYEKVICRRNNWLLEQGGINLTNGLTGIVMNQPDVRGFDGDTYTIDFCPMIAPDIMFHKVKCSYRYLAADRVQKDAMKKFKRVKGNFFEFGYSQTVHLAQGSQWKAGMYYEEYLNPNINNNLNYTAITRFSDMCIYVKQRRKYY